METQVSAAIFDEEKKVLLLKYSNYKPNILNKWGIPGGSCNKGEAPFDAVRREIFEETSLTVSDVVNVWETEAIFVSDGSKRHVIIFLCTGPKGNIKLSNEHLAFEWVAIKDLNNVKFVTNDIKNWIKTAYEKLG